MASDLETADARRSGALILQYIDLSADAIVVVNGAGIITRTNVLAGAMFGYDSNELVGSSVERLIPERFRAVHPSHRKQFFKHPSVRSMGENLDLSAVRSDGREFAVEIALRPIEIEGEECVLAVIRGIPIPKKMEIQLHELTVQVASLKGDIQSMIELTVAPVMGRVDTLEGRMTTFEKAHSEDAVMLAGMHRTLESLAHFLKRFFKFAGLIASAVIIAIVIAYALKWLHLK